MSNLYHDRNETTSNNDNNSQGQKSLFTFFSNIQKKFKQVFVDLSDEEYENNLQAKSDSYSVSNNLQYLYDAPSLNQNNDYKFYENASFGNSNKNRNNLFNQAKDVSNFSNRRKNSEEMETKNYNQNLSLKEKESNNNAQRAHPIVKIINTILSNKYNLGPIEKETLLEKTCVFSYNSAFKPIINKSLEESYPDLILNNSYEKLSSLKKRNFLLDPLNLTNSTSNYNLLQLDNSVNKPKVYRLWENIDGQNSYNKSQRLLSKKRSRYENDDYAKYSPNYEKSYRRDNEFINNLNGSYRNSRQNKFSKEYEMERNEKAYNDSKANNDSRISFSNVNLSGLKLNQLQKSNQNKKLIKQENLDNKSLINSIINNDDKNSIFSNQNIQDKNDIFFNKPFNKIKPDLNFNNEINLSTIDNLNSSMSSKQNNLDLYGNKGLKDKSLEEIRVELNEKKKANQKLLNEIHSKTKRSFRGENFAADEFSHSNSYSKKLLGNKSNLRSFNDEDEIVNYQNKKEEVDDFNYLDDKRRKIAEFYRNKDLMNKKDMDLISGINADYYKEKNQHESIFDRIEKKFSGKKLEVGKTFSFKNVNKQNKYKRSDQDEEIYIKEKESIFIEKNVNLNESDKESASFGGDESIQEKSQKSIASKKSIKKAKASFKDENKNENNLLATEKKEEEKKPLFSNTNKDNENKTKTFDLLGKNQNNNFNKEKDLNNIFGNKVEKIEVEKEKHENINEIKKPSLFDSKNQEDQVEKKSNIISNKTKTGDNEEKEKEINLPSNNNLFGINQHNNQNSLFGLNNQEKPKLFDNKVDNDKNNDFPIFKQMIKKSENMVDNKKTAETKPLFGNLVNTSNSLFGAANAPIPELTPLFGENKVDEKKKEIKKADANAINNNQNINKSLFSFGTNNESNNKSSTLFGNSQSLFGPKADNTKSLFSFAEKKENKEEKNDETIKPKLIEGNLQEKQVSEPIDTKKEDKKEQICEKKEDQKNNEFSLFNDEEEKENKQEIEKEKNDKANIGFKPTIPGTGLFAPYTSTPTLFANANKDSLFGKAIESTKSDNINENSEKNPDKEVIENKSNEIKDEKKEEIEKPKEKEAQTSTLFGNTSGLGSSLFGDSNKNKPALGLFGQSTETPKPTENGGLFGKSTNQSLFSKPETEPKTSINATSSLFSQKPAEQNTTLSSTENNIFSKNNPQNNLTSKTANNNSLFSNTIPTGLFGTNTSQKPNDSQKAEIKQNPSLFGNLPTKPQELNNLNSTIDNNVNNKPTSLFTGVNNLTNKTDNNNNNSSLSLFTKTNNENISTNLPAQTGLFSGSNTQPQNQTNNVFLAQSSQIKTGSLFSSSLNSTANNNEKLGLNSGFGLNANTANNFNELSKVEAGNGSNNLGNADQNLNKSLLNDKNPFLQKTNIATNNLFTSNNNNLNSMPAQNNNFNSNMNQQTNTFLVNSDKRNNGNRLDNNQGIINNFGTNIFSNENKAAPNPFNIGSNSVFPQQNTNNSLFSNSSSLFGTNNANTNNNMGSSLFGNNSAPNNAFGNNNNNNNFNTGFNGGNDDMTISPVRSPNLQPKMNNTNVNSLFGGNHQQQNNSLFSNPGNNMFNQQNTNHQLNNANSLFGNTNQNTNNLFNYNANNITRENNLFSNIPNFLSNNNNNTTGGFTFGKK